MRENAFCIFLLGAVITLLFYGVLSQQMNVKEALTFLTGLLSSAGIGASVE